jgi:hypothetical protein
VFRTISDIESCISPITVKEYTGGNIMFGAGVYPKTKK